jgi:hypothetical protein
VHGQLGTQRLVTLATHRLRATLWLAIWLTHHPLKLPPLDPLATQSRLRTWPTTAWKRLDTQCRLQRMLVWTPKPNEIGKFRVCRSRFANWSPLLSKSRMAARTLNAACSRRTADNQAVNRSGEFMRFEMENLSSPPGYGSRSVTTPMETESEFDELAGIYPGATTLGQLRARLGQPDDRSQSQSTDGSHTGELDVFLRFRAHGIDVLYTSDSEVDDTTIDEVRLLNPNAMILRCGLRIGMPREEASELIERTFPVIKEYDDSIYFVPSKKRPLIACAEFVDENVITSLELYIDDEP